MSATLEAIGRHLEELQRECAEAMEAATVRAAAQAAAEREGLIALGRQQERERTLLAIALVGAELKEQGTNARALATLRRYVLGEGA